jgi:hypothetical protein
MSTVDEVAVMRAAFPAWNIWRSDEGQWWASRYRPLAPSCWPDGYALTVTAQTSWRLQAEIAKQPA